MPSHVAYLVCPKCDRRHDHREPQNLCSCGSPLLVDYDLEAIAANLSKDDLLRRPPTMWRYAEFLPVERPESVVTLGEGLTPLLRLERIAERWSLPQVWLKDDGLNPTGTFKARGAACGVSRALELGIREVALPTAGNAGGAWACYGNAVGMGVHVTMPADAPESNQLECRLYGAEVTLVDGLISDAARVVEQGVRDHGWFDVSTLKEPYRIEGKKTLGLEIAEQLDWRMPDAIIYPAGGGVGLIGIWRAMSQLSEMGWVVGKPPRLVVAQAEGCAPLVKAFEQGLEASEPWPGASTIAAGLRVPHARGDFLVLRAVRETGGTAIAISDDDMLEAMGALARTEGVLVAPEGGATLAAARLLVERGDLRRDESVVLVNTGTGLKYPEAMRRALGEKWV